MDTLSAIESLTNQMEALTVERELNIAKAVAAGSTWSEIAARLGCTAQSAHRRYCWLRHNEATGEVWRECPLPI
jgi:FixJ family two-component response regulator